MTKTQYLLRSILGVTAAKVCPYCQGKNTKVTDSKYVVTTLNECQNCKLMFRHPVDSVAFNKKFYQSDYEQHDGSTTDLPSDTELEQMMAENFIGFGRDFQGKIDLLKQLLEQEGHSVIDYGANWGYTSYQFKKSGFDVQSFEISKPRALFGKKLGLSICVDESDLKPGASIFFNSHVIEHVPNIKNMFKLAQSLLSENGFFVAYCPNGSAALRKVNPVLFHNFWGQVHPNCLSAEFFAKAFKDVAYLIGSELALQEEVGAWDKKSQKILNVTGNELFVFAKIKKQGF